MLENNFSTSCVASRFFSAACCALRLKILGLMFIAILSFSVQNIFAQQSPTSSSSAPTTQPAPTTTPSLQSGSFWSPGPPKSNAAPTTPTSTALNPVQPSSTQPTGAPPSLNPPINNSLPPASTAPVVPNTTQPINASQPNNTASPAMPSLNPPANNFAPNNVPLNNSVPVNSSAYGSGVNLPPSSTSLQPNTSVYGPSMPVGPALTAPNNSLPPNNYSPAPNTNSFSQPQSSLPPASNFGQSPSPQFGAPPLSGPALGAPMNGSPYGNPPQNNITAQPNAAPQQNPAPSNDVFQNPLLPNVAPTNPQFGATTQPNGQPQFGEQSQTLNPSQFTAQGINQPIGGTTLQSAPTIATWGEFETAKTIAMVGGEPIISYDIEEFFIRGMEAMRAKDPNAAPPSEEEKKAYTRIILKQMIETKILYADALKNVPKENLEKMRSGVAKEFEAGYIKRLLEKNNVKTRAELEKVMIKKGTTLDRESQKFFEQSLADMWERQNVKKISVVPLADVVSYYKQHQSDYEFPAKARWEQLMISFNKVSDKVQAQNALATMGNRVIQGAPLGEIAEKESHGPTAYQKGQYDWTSKDALRSKVLNDAIFALPVNQLSVILEDESGYHIIRVLERKEAGCVPFEEAQVEIRKNLIDEEQKKIKDAYIKKVKDRIAVWTIFDNEKPTSEVAKEQDPLRK